MSGRLLRFLVWCPARGQTLADALPFDAFDAGEAAGEWANYADWHGAEFLIVGGESVVVCVQDGDRVTKFEVRGETTRSYWANELTEAGG